MSASSDLEKMISKTSPEVQAYVKELQAENSRLVKRVAKAEAQLTTANSMIEQYKLGKTPNPHHYLSDAELIEIAKGNDGEVS